MKTEVFTPNQCSTHLLQKQVIRSLIHFSIGAKAKNGRSYEQPLLVGLRVRSVRLAEPSTTSTALLAKELTGTVTIEQQEASFSVLSSSGRELCSVACPQICQKGPRPFYLLRAVLSPTSWWRNNLT
jgi:hypothetical protein